MVEKSPIIISFIGPVGVGKSTQMRFTANYFRSHGRRTVETYIKSVHGSTYILSLGIKKVLDLINKNSSFAEAARSRRNLQNRLSPLWNLSETVSIGGKFFLCVYLPFFFGFNVLIEEGLIMSIENYLSFRPMVFGLKSSKLPFLELLLRWVDSRKHLYVILDASDEFVAARRLSRSFRRSERDDYVKLQRIVMSKLGGPDVFILETSGKSIYDVNSLLLEHLEKNNY